MSSPIDVFSFELHNRDESNEENENDNETEPEEDYEDTDSDENEPPLDDEIRPFVSTDPMNKTYISFNNGRTYDIDKTVHFTTHCWMNNEFGSNPFQSETFQEILTRLKYFKNSGVHSFTSLPDPYTDEETILEEWFYEYGIKKGSSVTYDTF